MSRKRRTAADEPYLVVRTSRSDHRDGDTVGEHRHAWHQLIYVTFGLMRVSTPAGSWIAPPTWAVWVPAETPHGIRFVGPAALRTVYFRPHWRGDLPGPCSSRAVSPLLRELIVRTTEIGMLDRRDPAEAAIAEVLAGELGRSGPAPFSLPEPTSPETVATARAITGPGGPAAGTAVLARAVGLSPRTLERRFQAETGMTLGRWRQQRMLLRGMEQVAAGATVADAAGAAGYRSPSAFIAAFRRTFNATPATYF